MEHHIYLANIPTHLDTHVHAGAIWCGKAVVCSWARTQGVLALSAAEAEFNAIVAGIGETIFVVNSLRKFLGKETRAQHGRRRRGKESDE